jgi:hypothetical protein
MHVYEGPVPSKVSTFTVTECVLCDQRELQEGVAHFLWLFFFCFLVLTPATAAMAALPARWPVMPSCRSWLSRLFAARTLPAVPSVSYSVTHDNASQF